MKQKFQVLTPKSSEPYKPIERYDEIWDPSFRPKSALYFWGIIPQNEIVASVCGM